MENYEYGWQTGFPEFIPYTPWSNYYDIVPLYYAHNLYLNDVLVTDLVIPDSVTSIGNAAFRDCTGLISVVISDSVTSIDSYAFYGCTGLRYIEVSDGIMFIGEDAFTNL